MSDKIKLFFMPISLLFSFWISGIIPGLLTFFIFQNLELIVFVIVLPIVLLLDYIIFMLILLFMFKIFRGLYSEVPDGEYTVNDYEYYRYGVRHTYYRIYLYLLPEPIVCLPQIYRFFGAKIGDGNYIGGHVLDPDRIEIGDNNFIGKDANLSGHIFQDSKLELKKIIIGDKVTIGGGSLIFPGAVIKNDSVVGAITVVPKNKVIPKNTIWVGSRPKKIKKSKK